MTLTPQRPGGRRALPMAGHTHANRSAVTCHLRCGDACFREVPNTTETSYFRDVAASALSRRTVLGAAAVGAATVAFAPQTGGRAAAAPLTTARGRGAASRATGLAFDAIGPVATTVDDVTVPSGFRWHPIIRWGDPLFARAPEFDRGRTRPPRRRPASSATTTTTSTSSRSTARAAARVLVANHEYTNETIMFPADDRPRRSRSAIAGPRTASPSSSCARRHRASRGPTSRRAPAEPPHHRRHRRSQLDGPAAGSALLRTAATRPAARARHPEQLLRRHDPVGHRALRRGKLQPATSAPGDRPDAEQSATAWRRSDCARLGAVDDALRRRRTDTRTSPTASAGSSRSTPSTRLHAAQAHRDGPLQARGRQRHRRRRRPRGGLHGRRRALRLPLQVRLHATRTAPASQGAAQHDAARRGRPVRRQVHRRPRRPRSTAPASCRADGAFDGTGEWLPLAVDGESVVPGMTTEEVLVYTRLAADKVGATKMDRPEDVAAQPASPARSTSRCTNNTDRGKVGKEAADRGQPAQRQQATATSWRSPSRRRPRGRRRSRWNLLLVCGDPATNAGDLLRRLPGRTRSRRSPARTTSPSTPRATCGSPPTAQPSTISYADGLFKVPLDGRRARPGAAVPGGPARAPRPAARSSTTATARSSSPCSTRARTAPGRSSTSYFPDFVGAGGTAGRGQFAGPRPTVVQVTRR